MTLQVLEWVGALGVLSAFTLAQLGRLSEMSAGYGVLNLVAGAILAAVGIPSGQWGFVVLNGAWATIACYGLVTRWAKRPCT